jgi:hypothetical protein
MGRSGIAVAALLACHVSVAPSRQALDPAASPRHRNWTEPHRDVRVAILMSRIESTSCRHRWITSRSSQPFADLRSTRKRTAGRGGLYGQREALATSGDCPSRVDLIAELTFILEQLRRGSEFTVTLCQQPVLRHTRGHRIAFTLRPAASRDRCRIRTRAERGPHRRAASAARRQRCGDIDGAALDAPGAYVISIREREKRSRRRR